eukprot:COSAG06_NODE_2428_length_6891_cov_11.077433_1_plen_1072_part_00
MESSSSDQLTSLQRIMVHSGSFLLSMMSAALIALPLQTCLNEWYDENWKRRTLFWLLISSKAASAITMFAQAPLNAFLLPLAIVAQRLLPHMTMTDLLCVQSLITLLSYGMWLIRHVEQFAFSGFQCLCRPLSVVCQLDLDYAIAVFCSIPLIAGSVHVAWIQRPQRDSGSSSSSGSSSGGSSSVLTRSAAYINSIAMYLVYLGLAWLIFGMATQLLAPPGGLLDRFDLWFCVCQFAVWSGPGLCVEACKTKLQHYAFGHADASQRQKDGAFLAALITDRIDDASWDNTAGSLEASVEQQDELQALARSKLRRMRWSKLTPQVFALGGISAEEHLRLSEPCSPGEIDFYISHAWKDDAAAKYRQLEVLAKRFYEIHGREPTFCLSLGADDLKCLPLFIMACSKLLVLYGVAYRTELLAIWELYVCFAMEIPVHRIQFVSLFDGLTPADDLRRFDVEPILEAITADSYSYAILTTLDGGDGGGGSRSVTALASSSSSSSSKMRSASATRMQADGSLSDSSSSDDPDDDDDERVDGALNGAAADAGAGADAEAGSMQQPLTPTLSTMVVDDALRIKTVIKASGLDDFNRTIRTVASRIWETTRHEGAFARPACELSCDLSGWMSKKSSLHGGLQRRFFVAFDGHLYYFKSDTERVPKRRAIALRGAKLKKFDSVGLLLTMPSVDPTRTGGGLGGPDIAPQRTYELRCADAKQRDEWHEKLTDIAQAGYDEEESGSYHVMISYRVYSDKILAQILFDLLSAKTLRKNGKQLRVFLDSQCLRDGERWDSGFMDGLASSWIFVPIVSAGALEPMTKLMGGTDDDGGGGGGAEMSPRCDNVLLEWVAALELLTRQDSIKAVLPILRCGTPGFWGLPAKMDEREHQPTIAAAATHLRKYYSASLGGPSSSSSSASASASASPPVSLMEEGGGSSSSKDQEEGGGGGSGSWRMAAGAEADRGLLLNGVAQLIADVECQPPSPGGSPRPAAISVKGVVDTVLRFQGCKVVLQKEDDADDADGDAAAAEVMEACRRIFEKVEAVLERGGGAAADDDDDDDDGGGGGDCDCDESTEALLARV